MTTYQEMKSVRFIAPLIALAASMLEIQFRTSGENRFTAFCPFHADTKDSFRVFVNDKGEVRFHCFGACNGEWDIYDLIMRREKCSFDEAQKRLASHLGLADFKAYHAEVSEPPADDEPEQPMELSAPKQIDLGTLAVLKASAIFYNRLLLENPDRFAKVLAFLAKRGVDRDMIDRFRIGFAPSLSDDAFAGRALLEYHLDWFNHDFRSFEPFVKAGLFRLLHDETIPGFRFFRQHIDFSRPGPFSRNYADFFAGRIVFPICNKRGQIQGLMGRRPDNRGTRWVKQRSEGIGNSRSWLYGIDKAGRWIKRYQTVILVEGIFDYFAFYRLFQDIHRPIVISTLGTALSQEALTLLQSLGVRNYVVAFDGDEAGSDGIKRVAAKIEGSVHYLGGLQEGEDPADKLKGVFNSLSGFGLERLLSVAKKVRSKSGHPVMVSVLPVGQPKGGEIIFKPGETLPAGLEPSRPEREELLTNKVYFEVGQFLPLLSYDHPNKAVLLEKTVRLTGLLNQIEKPSEGQTFYVFKTFIRQERYDDLGPALILWLRLLIEQQTRKRKVKATDAELAEWLKTSRVSIIKYKKRLALLGYLNISSARKTQSLSVSFSPSRSSTSPDHHDSDTPPFP